MKTKIILAAGLAVAGAGAAHAGGIDRSGQWLSPLFQKGNYAELGFGSVNPSVSGQDVALFGGKKTGNVAGSFVLPSLSLKQDLTDKLSYAIILDQGFGADTTYSTAGSVALGGTKASATTNDLTGVLRYKLNKNFSVIGGLRVEQASGNITLGGLAYGGVNGYNVDLKSNTATGYLLGVAYEIPEYALRVDLTYNSSIKHNFGTVETLHGGTIGTTPTPVNTPESWNLEFQSGVNKSTLVFGSIRWARWSQFQINPKTFYGLTGGGLVNLQDTTDYTLGLGHKFTDTWSGAIAVNYEPKGKSLVSPLAPTNGNYGLSLAAIYTQGNVKVTTGVNYTVLGDAQAQTSNTARATFSGNHAISVGVKVGFTF
ncbi:MAG: outer membrane protein transport protein [Paracoccaceae bacterium]|nr:outer membrane protein transport protein [Paracoccaceae bacterium]